MLKIQGSKTAVSTIALAIVAILAISAAAAGIYVFVLSDDKALPENDTDDNDQDDGSNDQDDEGNGEPTDNDLNPFGFDFTESMVEGTLGVGTTYTYDCTRNGVPDWEMTMSITGQSGSYYVIEFDQDSYPSKAEMIHKKTGELRFSEFEGIDGEYEGEALAKWKRSAYTTEFYYNEIMADILIEWGVIFLSNSKSVLPHTFYFYEISEVDGHKNSSKITKGTLRETSIVEPGVEYVTSIEIGSCLQYSVAVKDGEQVIGDGKYYYRLIGDIGSEHHLVFLASEYSVVYGAYPVKEKMFSYVVLDNDLFQINDESYTYEGDVEINTEWGDKECALYSKYIIYYDYNGDPRSFKSEIYIGNDDGITYLTNTVGGMFISYGQYWELTLVDYILNF